MTTPEGRWAVAAPEVQKASGWRATATPKGRWAAESRREIERWTTGDDSTRSRMKMNANEWSTLPKLLEKIDKIQESAKGLEFISDTDPEEAKKDRHNYEKCNIQKVEGIASDKKKIGVCSEKNVEKLLDIGFK
ncbi:hypothetical protein Cni_G01495 [Canna indica]|uniref:Uncharacterized protein n=1 Tax=Canna indica TaxID=4628 RepID=A0AAQ3JPA3_9LILI|nr:hypothetical protein Cni_G01495 [Canna indica]